MDVKSILSRIDEYIRLRGMTKEEFYSKSGISSATFSYWNTGKYKPTPKKLRSAAETLGVDYNFLLTGESAKEEKPATETGDELDATTKELLNLAATLDPADVHMLLDMAKAIKARRKEE